MNMNCPTCGAAVTGDERYCEKCGTPIGQQSASAPQTPPMQPNMQQSHQVYQSAPQKPKNMFSDPNIPGYEKGQIIIVFALGLFAAMMIFSSGLSMSGIQSVGGKTMEEVFYQYMGRSLIGFSAFILAMTVYYLAKMTNKYNGRYTK